MKKENSLISKLDDHYFWDVDITKIDPEKSKRLIIERVFSLGSVKDIRAIIDYYGTAQVVEQLAILNYLDTKTLNFASLLFDKPKEEFRCYTKKPSQKKFWNS